MNQILLIDKPAGITSHDVVDRVRRIFHTRKVGHAGTLDPFATGLLIIGVGDATKELSKYVGLDKTYIATAKLGATSTTDDPEGVITATPDSLLPTPADISRILSSFLGTSEQTTPLFSAKKVGGKKMYDPARQGLGNTVERPKKMITITEIYSLPTSDSRLPTPDVRSHSDLASELPTPDWPASSPPPTY